VTEFIREVKFEPGFDKRSTDPGKNYGIHGVEIRFLLRGPDGVVQFVCYTGWFPASVEDSARIGTIGCFPMGADRGYHSPTSKYEGQEPMPHCDILPGGKCYYDGSSLAGDDLMKILIAEGDEAVWKNLENYYQQVFHGWE